MFYENISFSAATLQKNSGFLPQKICSLNGEQLLIVILLLQSVNLLIFLQFKDLTFQGKLCLYLEGTQCGMEQSVRYIPLMESAIISSIGLQLVCNIIQFNFMEMKFSFVEVFF
jgi:hypothetical protein